MSKQKKSMSEMLREERLKLEASAIAITHEQEMRKKRKWKYSTEKMISNAELRVSQLLSGERKTPVVKKSMQEHGKRGPKPKEENKNLARFHHVMSQAIADRIREHSRMDGVPIRRIVEEGIRLYFENLKNKK